MAEENQEQDRQSEQQDGEQALETVIRERDEARSALAAVQRELDGLRAEGRARFTVHMGGEDGQMSRQQIMAIRDRKQRRAAIAQNLNLFEKEI